MTSRFVWYELMTRDPGAAAAFYGEVLGWTVRDAGQADVDYRRFQAAGVDVAGVMPIPPEGAAAGMPPRWFPYLNVANLEQSLSRIVAAGGAVHAPPVSVPGVGRIAMAADPEGALFNLIAPVGEGPWPSFAPGTPGHGGWHQLNARAPESALAFYRTQFGWASAGAHDLGSAGPCRLFNCGDGPAVGGVVADSRSKRPHWILAFNVRGLDAALRRAVANGGILAEDVREVSTGEGLAVLQDPQGAGFALVGRRR